MIKEGDKFVYFTKYGGIVKGEVLSVNEGVINIDLDNKLSYYKPTITTTNGVQYPLSGVFKISQEFTQKKVDDLQNTFTQIKK